jgi:hypothetical protein
MFAYLFRKLCDLLGRAEHSRRDAYLESSVDICELERRMRSIEINDFPVTRMND